jgi:protein phosphatase
VELLEAKPETNLYAARDLGMCPNCGAPGNTPGEPFCVECGIELKNAGAPVFCKLREACSPEALGVASQEALSDGDRFYLRLVEEPAAGPAAATPASSAAQRGLALAVGYASHVGMVRELDEDSLCVFTLAGIYESAADPLLGLFIVADGMGGYEGGEIASKMTVQTVARELIKHLLLRRFLGEFQGQADAALKLATRAIAEANKKVHALAEQRADEMGSTVTLALVMDSAAYIANVGDSRTYIHREGKLRQITTDHSVVASLVTAGVLAPEEIYTHPERSVVYRSIGAKATVEVDTFEESLGPGDTLLLCCDGLWEAIRDEGIEEVLLAYPDPQAACAEMVRRANLAGGEDNISVIVVKVK